jgi:hypothetical protein
MHLAPRPAILGSFFAALVGLTAATIPEALGSPVLIAWGITTLDNVRSAPDLDVEDEAAAQAYRVFTGKQRSLDYVSPWDRPDAVWTYDETMPFHRTRYIDMSDPWGQGFIVQTTPSLHRHNLDEFLSY